MKIKNRLGTLPQALLLIGVMSSAATVRAQSVWEVVPQVSLSVHSNDNARLREAGDDSASFTRLDARVRLATLTQNGNFFVEPRVRSDAQADEEDKDLESDDWFLRVAGGYNWELASVGLRANYSEESVWSSELVDATPDDPDVEDPIDTDTGRLVAIEQDRERLTVRPFIDFNLSDRSSLRLEARRIDVTYSEAELRGRTSFDDTLFAAGLVRRVDERNTVTARVFASEYNAVLNSNQTDTFGVQGTFSRPLTDIWNFALEAGVQRSDFIFIEDGEVVDNADSNFTFQLRFRRRTERLTTNIDFNRWVTPNAIGFVVQRTEVRAYALRRLTQRLQGSVGIRYAQTKSLDDVSTNDDRDYGRVEMGLEWEFANDWSLDAGYQYTTQQFVNEETAKSDSNALWVRLSYSGSSRR